MQGMAGQPSHSQFAYNEVRAEPTGDLAPILLITAMFFIGSASP